tara:strand:- start:10 stop:159 length:150 start_codon:yes stop_codon:yes gene_type:complete
MTAPLSASHLEAKKTLKFIEILAEKARNARIFQDPFYFQMRSAKRCCHS